MSDVKVLAAEMMKWMGGAGRLSAMIGAKDFLCGFVNEHKDDYFVVFKHMRGANGENYFRITYNRGPDLYTIEFLRIRAGKTTVIRSMKDVYGEDLIRIFEEQTKLYLHF